MAKAAQRTSNSALQKRNNSRICLEDRISHFPDDILLQILSLLTMQEAARTSVLSSRWKNMWMYVTGSLDFDGSKDSWGNFNWKKDFLELERSKYVSWVDQVLNSHKGTTIEKFRVSFNLDKVYWIHVDRWINMALEKRVQRLELKLKLRRYYNEEGRYCFPSHSHVLSRFENLTSLRLDGVDVSGEVLEYLLSNCLFLEELHVVDSTLVRSLKLSGPSLKLKSLFIVRCVNVKYIEISSVNLVSFKFHGDSRTSLLLENVSNLKDLSFGGSFADGIYKFLQCSGYLLQLEKLELYVDYEVLCNFPEIPQLRNLRQLKLSVGASKSRSLLPCIALLNASPFLYRFAITLRMWGGIPGEINKARIAKNPNLKSIKVVEVANFAGYESDIEFAEYLLKNAVSLKKMTIDTRDSEWLGCPRVWETESKMVCSST